MTDPTSPASPRRVWMITGSSRGLGRELVAAALETGDAVCATARDPRALGPVIDRFGPDRVLAAPLDVTDAEQARRAVGATVARFGRLDVVVNNAGYANSAPIETMSDAEFRAQVETNLCGVVNVTRAALPVLRAQGAGTFLQVSAVEGRVGGDCGTGAYECAKHAVEGVSEVLAREVHPFGVRIVVVEPGALRTDWRGDSMTAYPPGPGYETTVGAAQALAHRDAGHEPGDPARAARTLVALLGRDTLPFRLPLGSDAVERILQAESARIAETSAWASVSRSADFPRH